MSGRHSIWPQLIGPDGLSFSDRTIDTPVVLRWTEVSGDTVTEKAQVLYADISGPVRDIASWSIAATFPGANCSAGGCWNGDYKYGAFYRKSSGKLSYFTPWTGGGVTPGTSTPINFIAASGAFIEVTP